MTPSRPLRTTRNQTEGGSTYIIRAAGTGTADGGTFIDFTGFQLERIDDRPSTSPPTALGAADGFSRPLSTQFASLAAAQAVYPHAVALTDEMGWVGAQAAANRAKATGQPLVSHLTRLRVNRTIDAQSCRRVWIDGQIDCYQTTEPGSMNESHDVFPIMAAVNSSATRTPSPLCVGSVAFCKCVETVPQGWHGNTPDTTTLVTKSSHAAWRICCNREIVFHVLKPLLIVRD